MAVDSDERNRRGISDRLGQVIRGGSDPRIRATWRVLLAVPIFWILAGGVLAGNLQTAVEAIPAGSEPLGGLAFSLLHGGFALAALVGWARYVDRRPLSEYGMSATPSWVGQFLFGLGAVIVAFGLWFGVASVLGWASLELSMSAPAGSLLVGLGLFVVTLGIHALIQQLVFFRIVLGNAAEGLSRRGLAARRAVIGGILVAAAIFLSIHQLGFDLRLLDLVVVGLIYGLVYAHTGELAVGIGLHLGVFVAAQTLFVSAVNAPESVSVFAVTQSIPEPLGVVGSAGFPKMVVAYLLVLAYLGWRHGGVPIDADVARWREGPANARD